MGGQGTQLWGMTPGSSERVGSADVAPKGAPGAGTPRAEAWRQDQQAGQGEPEPSSERGVAGREGPRQPDGQGPAQECFGGTWVAQSVKRLPSAQVMIPGSWATRLAGSLLLPLLLHPPPSLCPLATPTCLCARLPVRARSLSQIKK